MARSPLAGALAAAALVLWASPVAASQEVVEADLEVVARLELGPGPFGDVAAVGTTVVVASGACPATATVVDARRPERPIAAATISLPPGTAAADVDGIAVETPTFTGDLIAVALAPSPCGGATPLIGGALYYDITEPAAPKLLGRTSSCPGCGPATPSVSLGQRPDGRTIAVRLDGPDALTIDDVTDPTRPATLVHWPVPPAAQPAAQPQPQPQGCALPGPASSVQVHDDGQAVVVVLTDGRVFDLDLADPAAPVGDPTELRPGGRSTYAAVLPLGRRTVGVVAEQHGREGCTGEPGLRLLELSRGSVPSEMGPVRFTTPVAPGRLTASGELAYVAWHEDGLRIVDLSQVRARTVAQFRPETGDVVGVALLPEHVVTTDATSGLYVLQRPDEGGDESSFWSQLVGVLPYLGFAVMAAAAFVVPRLAMGRAPVGGGVPGPVPEGAGRRRHA